MRHEGKRLQRNLHRKLQLIVFGALLASNAPAQTMIQPSSHITAVDAQTSIVAAKVNATGQTFQFKIADATLLRSLKIGQGVYANLKTHQVSVDGKTTCCQIISVGPMVQGGTPQSAQSGPASPRKFTSAICRATWSPVKFRGEPRLLRDHGRQSARAITLPAVC